MIARCQINRDHLYYSWNNSEQWIETVERTQCRYLVPGESRCCGPMDVVARDDAAYEAIYKLGGLPALLAFLEGNQ